MKKDLMAPGFGKKNRDRRIETNASELVVHDLISLSFYSVYLLIPAITMQELVLS